MKEKKKNELNVLTKKKIKKNRYFKLVFSSFSYYLLIFFFFFLGYKIKNNQIGKLPDEVDVLASAPESFLLFFWLCYSLLYRPEGKKNGGGG